MQRRSLLLLTPLLPLGLFVSRYVKAAAPSTPQPIDDREKALRLSQLASGIQTVADARLFVDFVADLFSEQLPSSLVSSDLRDRVAQAEFAADSDPQKLIPEWRVAEAWNTYAQTLKAPQECQVTTAEIHNLRDGFLATARALWERGNRNIWTVPAIYATDKEGAVAVGCRAIESVRIFWDLANMPDNLTAARNRVSQGVLASDLFRQAQQQHSMSNQRSYVSAGVAKPNPVEYAEREYVAKNGMRAFGKAVNTMLNQALA